MKPVSKYRGQHPTRIKAVYSVAGAVTVITNDGARYSVKPATEHGARVMPQLGKLISLYQLSRHYEVTP